MAATPRRPVRVGVAGWDYEDWYGTVYPGRKRRGFDPLRFLSEYIDLIEINSSFYGPPRGDVAKRWADRVDDRPAFRYTAKLWRRFTHERETAWNRDDVNRVRDGIAPLRDAGRLDALLVQFPWSYKNDEASREWLADLVEEFDDFPLAVEVRHASWNDPDFYAWLADRGVGYVNIDQPLFHRSIKPSARATASVGYIRVHGRNYQDWWRRGARHARYDYLYSPKELYPWVRRAREVADERTTDHVDVVFNNHMRGKAVANAVQFKKIMTQRKQPAPPTLFSTYTDALERYARPAASQAVEEEGEAGRRAA